MRTLILLATLSVACAGCSFLQRPFNSGGTPPPPITIDTPDGEVTVQLGETEDGDTIGTYVGGELTGVSSKFPGPIGLALYVAGQFLTAAGRRKEETS